MKSDGGPAFPVQLYSGMSLRDWFAGQALKSLSLGSDTLDWTEEDFRIISSWCCKMADATLKELAKE